MMYRFWGKVRKGFNRGKNLGFPTANIKLSKDIKKGIYISKTKFNGIWYQALTFIGKAKTFKQNQFCSETYILDFKQNLYNRWVSVKLLKKIRGNKKFKTVKELVSRMRKDAEEARDYFAHYPDSFQ